MKKITDDHAGIIEHSTLTLFSMAISYVAKEDIEKPTIMGPSQMVAFTVPNLQVVQFGANMPMFGRRGYWGDIFVSSKDEEGIYPPQRLRNYHQTAILRGGSLLDRLFIKHCIILTLSSVIPSLAGKYCGDHYHLLLQMDSAPQLDGEVINPLKKLWPLKACSFYFMVKFEFSTIPR